MIFAADVFYYNNYAIAAGLLFQHWDDSEAVSEFIVRVPVYEPYVSGAFYRRELPCLLTLIKQLDCLPAFIIIDGYVFLDSNLTPGLGKYLYDALECKSAVIGVAKHRYKHGLLEAAVYRCGSKRPLYVTAVGIDVVEARYRIAQMHGVHRIPTMLSRVDQLTKGKI